MHIVYAITSRGLDCYSAMTRVSLASIRLSNPAATVTIVCDPESEVKMRSARDPLLSEVDAVRVAVAPAGSAVYKNRHIKTRLRELVDGPFLFMDSDVLVRGDLSQIFDCDADVAGVLNHSTDEPEWQIWEKDRNILREMKWELKHSHYINGGVLYYGDTEGARSFGRAWHTNWLSTSAKVKIDIDQPALNKALNDPGLNVALLPGRFNSQFKATPRAAAGAVVWHYYSSSKSLPMTGFEILVDEVIGGRILSREKVKKLMAEHRPWRRTSFIDDWMIRRVERYGLKRDFETMWFQGRRCRSIFRRMSVGVVDRISRLAAKREEIPKASR